MDKAWIKDRRFSSLSIKDLLEAREAYHVHLAHLENVFATAIGRYLIRREDPEFTNPEATDGPPATAPRTLHNSAATKWSWPCLLVFVDKWTKRSDFADRPDAMVPRYLYLPDGRVVPTCVVFADRADQIHPDATPPAFPSDLLGGGYPALQDVQGRTRLGSIGCLVTDGDQVFALTNRHVTGEAGRETYTMVANRRQRVGVSAGRELGKRPFAEVYAGWQGSRVQLNLDAGLVRVDDITRWTAQVFGIGELGPIWDLNIDSFNLDVIGCPVKAYGASGGSLEGQIQALFFRYKTRGGVEYVTDFLIGPRQGATIVGTRPGDSGTIWFEDPPPSADHDRAGLQAPRLRPFAIQWGGESLTSPGSGGVRDFALATCLSTVCRELDVEIVTDWNIGQPETWGAVGHFKVGALACELVSEGWLHELFMLNLANIGYDDTALGRKLPAHPQDKFVPLADVADFVWRNIRKTDDNNHFADIDHEAGVDDDVPNEMRGRSLLDLTEGHPERVHPDYWNQFYAAIDESKRGALPFRVWQIYDAMVDFAHGGQITQFICAAGLMAHYVGDACQPLHVSEHHHGRNEEESGVHSAYETAMLAQNAAAMIAEVSQVRQDWPHVSPIGGGGQHAAIAVVELMRRTVQALPPLTVIDVFNRSEGSDRSKKMWRALGHETAARLVDGATTLARIWEGAWREGRGAADDPALPVQAESQEALMALYLDKTFLPSSSLQKLTVRDGRIVSAPEPPHRPRRPN